MREEEKKDRIKDLEYKVSTIKNPEKSNHRRGLDPNLNLNSFCNNYRESCKKSERLKKIMQQNFDSLDLALKSGWIPYEPSEKQKEFLLRPEKEAFYGGAAGGGKSDALLMGAIMFCNTPGYNAIIFRKTLKAHQQASGLIPRSKLWLIGTEAVWNGSLLQWTFPSSATISFGYLDGPDDHYNYQSSEFQYIAFDELPQIRESQFRYMFSRLRKLETQSEISLRVRSAGNPDGPYVLYVKRRYVDKDTAIAPFIPAKIDDNPGLDKESYRESLMLLEPVLRARLMDGDWEMRDQGRVFRRNWFEQLKVKDTPMELECVRYWDKAATKPQKGKDPDYTAGVLMGKDKKGFYYIIDVIHFRGTPQENEDRIKHATEVDKQRNCINSYTVYMEQEGGSAGVDIIDHYTRNVLPGTPFYGDKVTQSKRNRAAPFSSMAEAGNVYLVSTGWDIMGYLDELEAFPDANHDDMVDASSGAFNMLNRYEPVGGDMVPSIFPRPW
jgi:predicted phage terminase large subunit-like protein